MKLYLGLGTGEIFPGKAVGYSEETFGEVILYCSKKFHHEILTDPVYFGRIVVSDSPAVDNRQPMFWEIESYSPHLNGLVILGKLRKIPLQNKSDDLKEYLAVNSITGFKPEQPEKLKMVLQKRGLVFGAISFSPNRVKKMLSRGGFSKRTFNKVKDPIKALSTPLEFYWDFNGNHIEKRYIVVAYDLGLPYSILRNLSRFGCDIRVVPADVPPEEVIALKPEGILLAGGPGNPDDMGYAVNNIARLLGLRPILATGLGHNLLALSIGAKLERLKNPHFGSDIKVERETWCNGIPGKNGYRTNQTHGIGVNRLSVEQAGFKVTLVNPEDGSVEGYDNEDYLVQSYAFSLGKRDYFTSSCIRRFIDCMESHRARRN